MLFRSSGIQLIIPDNGVEAQVTADVNVIISPSLLLVDVSPTGTGIGTATIHLENTGPHQVTCTVSNEIEGYEASPRELTVSLGPYATRALPMSIVALLRSPYGVSNGIVTCTVKSVNLVPLDNWFINTGSYQVNTAPYSRLVIPAKEPFMQVWPGKSLKLKFDVYNEGNIDDTVRLDVSNRDELYRKGFSIALESSGSVLVLPRETLRMNIHVTTPKGRWEDDYYTIDVRAVSEFANSQSFDYSVTLWVRGVYVPGFDPVIMIFALAFMGVALGKRRD